MSPSCIDRVVLSKAPSPSMINKSRLHQLMTRLDIAIFFARVGYWEQA
ncbi:hypothetical protein [Legionella quateirensis]|nr:hypothetical protein [Legionella quateirensis]